VKTLHFSKEIEASRERVWDVMLTDETYRIWTEVFAAGSYFEGSWEKGAEVRFLSPEGGGMFAQIAESRRPEFLSIRHVGELRDGVPDTESEAVRRWAPAYENYTFLDREGTTDLRVDIDVTEDWESYMNEKWPLALERLKEICET
jgi:hypothetical protein